jgi:DNA-binding NarL/FixJ family response regulator
MNRMGTARRIRVLIVDDEPAVVALTMTLLAEDDQLQVVGVAANGREAVELARELRPAAVVMDLYMPILDGIAATREILLELPETRVVLYTSSDEPGDFDRAFAAGAAACVPKNAGTERLVSTIREVTLHAPP